MASVSSGVSPEDRRAFIAERRRVSVRRFDPLLSQDYDESRGAWTHLSTSRRKTGLAWHSAEPRLASQTRLVFGQLWPAGKV